MLACAGGCFFVLASSLRFGLTRSAALDSLSTNAYSLYLVHYVPTVWLQYALLGAPLIAFVKAVKAPTAQPIINTLEERLQHLVDIGLEYLNLNRETDTLSGGESQRVKIVKHLSSSL